jgi:hypothetical protein
MDYKGEWGGGGPGHSWALKWPSISNVSEVYVNLKSCASLSTFFLAEVLTEGLEDV